MTLTRTQLDFSLRLLSRRAPSKSKTATLSATLTGTPAGLLLALTSSPSVAIVTAGTPAGLLCALTS